MKIAIVNQRYGLQVNGGSELYTRQIAEHLNKHNEVEVLTTCALEYSTWSNYYESGCEIINGVRVRRFRVEKERDEKEFEKLTSEIFSSNHVEADMCERWIDMQGPYCPDFLSFLKKNRDDYDLFIVVTYLYFLAAKGMAYMGEKVIFIPTAHQEPYLDFPYYKAVFKKPAAFVFLTEEEKDLIYQKFAVESKLYEVMGVGVDVPLSTSSDDFKAAYNLRNYVIYVGRIDRGKNCKQLFDYFQEYKKRNISDLKLVLMGKAAIEIPAHKDIVELGFVSDEIKFNGIKGAKALILPSEFESLSISVLEAMALSIPVIVNGKCNVLKGHCTKSNAGLYYRDYFEFEGCINYIFDNEMQYEEMTCNAKKYIDTYFTWDKIMEKFERLIKNVIA